MTLKADEHERRLKIYHEHRTIEEMADAAGMTYTGFRGWMQKQGLKAHPDVGCISRKKREPRKPPKGEVMVFRLSPPYIHKRPEWEKDRMRHFLSKLVRAADTIPNETPNVEGFMSAYQVEFGCKFNEEVLYG